MRMAQPQLLRQIRSAVSTTFVALTAIGVTELVHGIHRTLSPERRSYRETFLRNLMEDLPVLPYTTEVAFLAGRIDAQQQLAGFTVPYPDLLIGATALSRNFAILTANERHFRMIPNLQVLTF